MSDIYKQKHLKKNAGSKISHVKKHLPQSLPREERYFCSEHRACSKDRDSRKFISGMRGKKPNTKKNMFQTMTIRSNHIFMKYYVGASCMAFYSKFFSDQTSQVFIWNYCPVLNL